MSCINNQVLFDTTARRSKVPGFAEVAVRDFAGGLLTRAQISSGGGA